MASHDVRRTSILIHSSTLYTPAVVILQEPEEAGCPPPPPLHLSQADLFLLGLSHPWLFSPVFKAGPHPFAAWGCPQIHGKGEEWGWGCGGGCSCQSWVCRCPPPAKKKKETTEKKSISSWEGVGDHKKLVFSRGGGMVWPGAALGLSRFGSCFVPQTRLKSRFYPQNTNRGKRKQPVRR